MITVLFFFEGDTKLSVSMPELPRVGEAVMLDKAIFRITDVAWRIGGSEFAEALIFGDYDEVSLESMPYPLYLTTRHWKKVRSGALVRAGYACQLCNTQQATLDVHHRTYERRGRELPEDLIVLCRSCHSKFHADNTASGHTIEDALRVYGEKIGRPTPIIARMIEEAAPVHGIETIIRAIGVADGADVRKWTYVEGVLRNWKEQQV